MDQPRSTLTRGRSADKRAAIVAGAMREFLAHGYAATSMDRVATAAGVSKATVYGHFNDKQTLFQALTQQMVDERVQRLFGASAAEAPPADPRQSLGELALRLLMVDNSQPEFLQFLRLVIGESGRFPLLAKDFVARIETTAFNQVVAMVIAADRDNGGIGSSGSGGSGSGAGIDRSHAKHRDPELTARIFIGCMIHLIIVQDILHGKEIVAVDRRQFAAGVVDMLFG